MESTDLHVWSEGGENGNTLVKIIISKLVGSRTEFFEIFMSDRDPPGNIGLGYLLVQQANIAHVASVYKQSKACLIYLLMTRFSKSCMTVLDLSSYNNHWYCLISWYIITSILIGLHMYSLFLLHYWLIGQTSAIVFIDWQSHQHYMVCRIWTDHCSGKQCGQCKFLIFFIEQSLRTPTYRYKSWW